MRRNPVDYYAYPGGMAPVHELHEVMRSAEAGGRRKVSYLLVAPASVVRILADGHKLNVGVAHILHIRDQLIRKLTVAEVILAVLAPGAYVHFIDIRGAVVNILCVKLVKIFLVRPLEALDIVELGCGVRAKLHVITIGVCLELDQPVRAFNAVFVVIVLLNAGNKKLPDSAVADLVHRVESPVPVIKVADNAYCFRIRSPYAENCAALSVLYLPVGAE